MTPHPPMRQPPRPDRRPPAGGQAAGGQAANGQPGDGRPKIGWADLRGATVGVWGIGVEGAANLRRLRELGTTAVLVDDQPNGKTFDDRPVLATAAGGLDALGRCDVVVKAPGISRYRSDVAELEAADVPVAGGLGLWMEEADRERVVCVTGTKGKSTTTAVAGHLLDRLGYRCLVGGNIGRPPWDPDVGDDYDFWVVETSSFQATDLASSPPVVAVTSLAPDHLDWHRDVERYYRDKLSACHQPGARLTIADGASRPLAERRDQLGPEIRWVHLGDRELDGAWVDGLGLLGDHHRRDALIARACLLALGVPEAADEDAVVRAAEGFGGLPSRLRPVGTVDGVVFVDDSLSTNVLPTLAALDSFGGRRVALLVGGHDRGIDYGPLADDLVGRAAPTLVLTLPASGPRIHAAIDAAVGAVVDHGPDRAVDGVAAVAAVAASGLTVADTDDLATATRLGFDWARPDGVVLLSPAAPSFGQFRDYAERAAAFADAMRSCGRVEPSGVPSDSGDNSPG
jgi:UDP-N-acetylmuramoyl-L-alanine---L-glutamate ligase